MTTQAHQGGCHCGAVRYSVEIDLDEPALACNCSMCGRAGTLLHFVPADQFKLESGEDNLSCYQFNKHVIDHLFCKTCGIKSFARGQGPKGPTVAVNVRCVDGVDPVETYARAKQFDGKSR
jgi:hypothetical protein